MQNKNTTSMARQTSVFRTITKLVPMALALAQEEKKPITSTRLLRVRVSKVQSDACFRDDPRDNPQVPRIITGDTVVFSVENWGKPISRVERTGFIVK